MTKESDTSYVAPEMTPEKFIDDICTKHHILQRVSIELTYRCNERCKHCYVADENKNFQAELRLKDYQALFDDLRKMETLYITLTGGDPSMHADFMGILKSATEHNFAVNIYTNGIGYSEETLNEIIHLHPRSISFSLYSGIASEHDFITGINGSFERTLATLKKVYTAGILVSVKVPLMVPTLKGFPALQSLCKNLDINLEVDYLIRVTTHGDISPVKLRLRDVEDYKKIMRIVQKDEKFLVPPSRDVKGPICGVGRLSLRVNPYGEVFPCNGFDFSLGNIKETPIQEIWEGERLKQISKLRFEQLGDSCVKCLWRNDCLFCLGAALSENGNMMIPLKEFCKIAQAIYEVRSENIA